MTRRLAVALLAWSLADCAAQAQPFPAWPGQPPASYTWSPYPAYYPGYPPINSRPYPTYSAPAPPLPVLTGMSHPGGQLAHANPLPPNPPPMIRAPQPLLPGPSAPAPAPDIAPRPAPPSEILPPPRELNPTQPPEFFLPEIAEAGPGSMITHYDGKPDTAPDCPPDAPHGHRNYGRAEYLMWWGQRQSAPVLLTEGTPAVPLVGGGEVGLIAQTRHGGRLQYGRWLNNCQDFGIEMAGFFIGGDDSVYERTSTGTPVLARPFIDGLTGLPAQRVIAAPGSPGIVDIGMLSRLWGLEGNVRCEICRWLCGHLDVLGGIRYLDFEENLTVLSGTNTRRGTANFAYDDFGARNRFIGSQVGLECELIYRKWFLDSWAKLAVGDNSEVVTIQGNRLIGGRVLPGGLLAQPSNIGRHRRDQFGFVPEVSVSAGYRVQEHLRATVGYNFLFLGNVARPGDQIDTRVNTTGAGPAVPNFSFNQGEFWIHGLTAGFEFLF